MLSRVPLRFLAAFLATLSLPALPAAAENSKDVSHAFQVTFAGQLDMESQGQTQRIDSDTTLRYTWSRRERERTLSFSGLKLLLKRDGVEVANLSMSRGGILKIRDGKREEVLFENLPEQLQTMLQDSFGAPVCKLQVDETGKEVGREVVAGPGAKMLVDMMANALLFHPPFQAGEKEWEADGEIPMGQGGHAKGKLTYAKVAGGNKGQRVKVSGTLTNDLFMHPGTKEGVKDARYVVIGEQTYDPAQQEWASGRLTIDVTFQMIVDDKPAGSAKGQIVASFDELAGKE